MERHCRQARRGMSCRGPGVVIVARRFFLGRADLQFPTSFARSSERFECLKFPYITM